MSTQTAAPHPVVEEASGPELAAVYADILSPSFPPHGLMTLERLTDEVENGTTSVRVVRDDAGNLAGTAIATWYLEARVLLIDYLALRPGQRGEGLGGALLNSSIDAWAAHYDPCIVIAEVEHPDAHDAHPQHGDPEARLRFYARQGARLLPLPPQVQRRRCRELTARETFPSAFPTEPTRSRSGLDWGRAAATARIAKLPGVFQRAGRHPQRTPGEAVTSALEKIDATTVKITVTLTEEEIKPALDHAYKHIGSTVTIPGFRKGKVPARILEQRVGKGAVIEHAINDGVPGWYGEAVEELELRPYGQPEIEVTKIPGSNEGDEGIEFVAIVEVRPEITLPPAADLVVVVEPVEVSDDDVEERMTALRQRFGTLVAVERAAEVGDFVTIDLTATIEGEQIDAVQGSSYQVGTGNMIDGLDDAVTGLKAGGSANFVGPLAAGDFAGVPAEIAVSVSAVKTRELPDADDDFAQLASEFDTLDELKADLRTQAGRIKTNNQAMEAREKLVEALVAAAGDFALPVKIVEAEVHSHLENENRLEDDEHRAEVTERAQTALRTQMLLDKLAEDLDVQVAENELVDYLVNASRQYGTDPGEFIQQVQRAGQIPSIVADVARSKATAFALRRATVKDTIGNPVDLSAIIGTLEDETASEEAVEVE